jgi:hypothetical protein
VAVVDALLGALSGGWAKDRQAARRGAIVALGVLAPRCGAATRERIATAVLATAGGTTDAAGVSASGSNAPERNAARVTLGRIAAVRDVDPALRARIVAHLRTALGERAEFASCHAALALGLVGRSADDAAADAGGPRPDAEILAALRQAFRDDLDPYRRGAYAIASGLARDADAAPALLAALRAATTPPTVRGSCAQALALLGRADGVATCRELLDDTASQRQRDAGWAAATSLTLVGGPVTAPTLLEVLRSRNECPWTLAAAADGLGLLRDTACVDALLAIASDADRVPPLGRALAVAALGRIAERADISPRALLAAGLDTAGRPDFGSIGSLLEIL